MTTMKRKTLPASKEPTPLDRLANLEKLMGNLYPQLTQIVDFVNNIGPQVDAIVTLGPGIKAVETEIDRAYRTRKDVTLAKSIAEGTLVPTTLIEAETMIVGVQSKGGEISRPGRFYIVAGDLPDVLAPKIIGQTVPCVVEHDGITIEVREAYNDPPEQEAAKPEGE
jgi:hypothetical protein